MKKNDTFTAANGFVPSYLPFNTWFWTQTAARSVHAAVFAQLTREPNTQTHRQTTLRSTSVSITPHLIAALRAGDDKREGPVRVIRMYV